MSFIAGLGQFLCVMLTDELDCWRLQNLLTLLFAVSVAVLVELYSRFHSCQNINFDNGTSDYLKYTADFSKVKLLLRNRSVLIIFAQSVPSCVPWSVVLSFLDDFLTVREGSVTIASLILLFFTIGGSLGSYLGQRICSFNRKLQCMVMSVTTALAGSLL